MIQFFTTVDKKSKKAKIYIVARFTMNELVSGAKLKQTLRL